MKTRSAREQMVGLDVLRFFAASWVLIFHIAYWPRVAPYLTHSLTFALGNYPELDTFAKIGWLGVPFFFIISGFVIAYSSESATPYDFAVSRIVRLFPGMVISATLILAVVMSVHLLPRREAVWSYLRSVTFMPFGPYIDASFWTLSVEITFYALVWGLLWKRSFSSMRALALAVGLVSTVFWLVFQMGAARSMIAGHVPERILEVTLLMYGVYFAIGVLLWLTLVKRQPGNLPWVVLFLGAGGAQITERLEFQERATGEQITILYPYLALLLFVLALSASIAFNQALHRKLGTATCRVIRKMGLMTYPLYLIHQTVGCYFLGVLIVATGRPYLSLWIVVSGCLLTAWVIATLIEPPFQRSLRARLQGAKRWLPENESVVLR